MSRADNQSEDYQAFLEAEIRRTESAEKLTWTIGIPIGVVIVGFLTILSYRVGTFVYNPKVLGRVMMLQLNDRAPQMIDEMESELMNQAPHLVGGIRAQAAGLVNEVAERTKSELSHLIARLPSLEKQLRDALGDAVLENPSQMKTLYLAGRNQKAAEAFAERLFDEVDAELRKEFLEKLGIGHFPSTTSFSVAQLRLVNEYLQTLARKHHLKMSPGERLQRRFLVAVTSVFTPQVKMAYLR